MIRPQIITRNSKFRRVTNFVEFKSELSSLYKFMWSSWNRVQDINKKLLINVCGRWGRLQNINDNFKVMLLSNTSIRVKNYLNYSNRALSIIHLIFVLLYLHPLYNWVCQLNYYLSIENIFCLYLCIANLEFLKYRIHIKKQN